MLEKLRSLFEKKEKLVVGLISGTSMDGIDAALLKINGSGTDTRIELINFICVPYDERIRGGLEALPHNCSTAGISGIDFLIGGAFADAALKVIDGSGTGRERVDLIGSHGQTVYHNPPSRKDGTPSTLQIGELDVIAEKTGITTVGDFRTRDIAAGGEGAPLVPYPDFLLFNRPGEVRIAQNIGGIANATILPGRLEDVTAFDTGPGNMLMDRVINISTGGKKRFDEDGEYASRGEADEKLLNELLSDPYFAMPPPKSTGEELFGKGRADALVSRVNKGQIPLIDLMATLVELTVKSISLSYERFIFPHHDVSEIIFSGGGCRNPVLMKRLGREFPGIRISTTDDYGVPSDAKEAVAFAILANELVSGNPGNLTGVTGATHRVPLGKIVLGGL